MLSIRKRLTAIVPAAILLSSTFAGCSGGGSSSATPSLLRAQSTSTTAATSGAFLRSSTKLRAAASGASYSSVVLADGPLAYYQLNDASSVMTDFGPNAVTGSYGSDVTHGKAALTFGATGASGFPGGTAFDPNGFAWTAPTAVLQPATVSVEAWFEFTTTSPASTYIPIVAYGDAKGVAYGLYLQGNGTYDTLYYQQYDAGQVNTMLLHGNAHLVPGTVYHVVATFDGTNIATYVNGIADRTATYAGTIGYKKTEGVGLQIGGEKLNSTYTGYGSFPGTIAQVAVYGTALPAQSVTNHYLAGQLVPLTSEAATSADAFVDSIGVNTHFTYDQEPYWTQFPQVKSLLVASGIRHYRDNLSYVPTFLGYMQQLGAANLHGDFVTLPTNTQTDIQGYPAAVGTSFESFEAPNEPDDQGNQNWVAPTITFQQSLYSWVKSSSATANFPVLGPALAWPHNYALLGDLSSSLDEGNVHDYMANYNPGFNGGPWGGMLAMIADAQSTSGTKPMIATEMGFGTTTGTTAVDLPTDLRYATRTFFEQFKAGVKRTYEYELIDEPSGGAFATYGILNNDLTPKPAYTGIKSIISALSDPGPTFQTTPLSYNISGLSTVHHLLMQKRNGTYILAVWQEVPSWNVSGGGDIAVTPQNVTITTGKNFSSVSLTSMDENGNFSTATLPWSNNQTNVNVSDKISLVTFKP